MGHIVCNIGYLLTYTGERADNKSCDYQEKGEVLFYLQGKPEPEEDQLTKDLGLAASSKVFQNNPELWESLHAAFKHAMEVTIF